MAVAAPYLHEKHTAVSHYTYTNLRSAVVYSKH